MNTPKWKLCLVIIVCLLSIYFSLPTLLPFLKESKIGLILPNQKVNLGLDLRGGAYILLELDLQSYEREQIQKIADQVRISLKNKGVIIHNLISENNKIQITLNDDNQYENAIEEIRSNYGNDLEYSKSGNLINLKVDEKYIRNIKTDILSQTIEIVRRRVDETGSKELDIQRQGDNYILLQVPGLDDPEQIKRLLGKTAKLTFHLVEDGVNAEEAMAGNLPNGVRLLPLEEKSKAGNITYVPIQARALLSGDMLVDARASVNNQGMPVVNFKLNNLGAKIFADVTTKYTYKQFAIVLDNKVISAPRINEPILSGNSQISGNFTVQSANELSLLLRAGALPVPLKVVEERTVGPSLGLDSIKSGTTAAIIGTILVMIFMVLFYSLFGVLANVALIFNLFLMVAVLALFNATLTLPGIAGMVLTLGMAVDANVLICERIREEIYKGRTPLSAIEAGYSLAFNTIVDSNITTVLATTILYIFGSGPVKGFAIAISVGIICSMFTAVTLTKVIVNWWYRKYKPQRLPL